MSNSSVQFTENVRELQQLKNQISRSISEMERLQGEERARKIRDIEDNLSNLNVLIQTIKDDMPMMEQTDRSKMAKILQDYQVDAQKLEARFKDARNRGELMGSSNIVLEGGSNAERQELINQRSKIEDGNQKLYQFNNMAGEIEEIGHGTLASLNEQKEKELDLGRKLNDLSVDMTIGERTADRMLCRQKRRTAILWIVIVLVVMVFLAVFLYFVFRP